MPWSHSQALAEVPEPSFLSNLPLGFQHYYLLIKESYSITGQLHFVIFRLTKRKLNCVTVIDTALEYFKLAHRAIFLPILGQSF
jgi:hypothetical protein